MLQRAQEIAKQAGLELYESSQGLVLSDTTMELTADFSRLIPRLRSDRVSRELLVRAARIKGKAHPHAVDATAGLGEDACLLAAAGFSVTLYERDPVIAALLQDGLRRASDDPRLSEITSRMHLCEGDSEAALYALSERPDIVLLDPMFPERTKSAAVKKKFQLLHKLEHPCDDEKTLLEAALAASPLKVVIKRPPKGPWLAGKRPSYALTGKAVRYDVIVPPHTTA